MSSEANPYLVISYMQLRRLIGYLGVAFPLLLMIGGWLVFREDVQPSISDYHYTQMRDVFSGVLCAIGVFLFSYQGPDRIDNIAGNIACLGAIGVAVFPTSPGAEKCVSGCAIGYLHLACATIFFLALIFFALVLFTKTNKPIPTAMKRVRNKVYIGCGIAMSACIALIALYFIFHDGILSGWTPYHPVFILESIAVEVFGFCWLVKGERLLKDHQASE